MKKELNSVRNKLMDSLIKEFTISCSCPVRISEREIARRYNTTAITVHSICVELDQSGMLVNIL